jgi:hypothetical protein
MREPCILAAWLLLALLTSAVYASAAPLRVCSLDAARLHQARSRVMAQDAALQPALDALRQGADKALAAGPFSVTHKERTPPSGDKHDYLSLAPYWWPDPQSADGLPYRRRDGETNPDSKHGTDALPMSAMAKTVETLALASFFFGEAHYAERAALLVRVWFLQPATRMNPHLRFAQAIPGRNDGRGAGLIESRHFITLVDAVGLLAGSQAWTDEDEQALVAWFQAFVAWMQASPHGKQEAAAQNNHGSWYAAQLACYALFIGDRALARAITAAARSRIAQQVEPDGRQPHELQRTRTLSYAVFNLVALMTLAATGQQVGVDLYAYHTPDGRSMRRALDYVTPFADAAHPWPHQQINHAESARADLAYLLRRAAIAWREPHYERVLEQHLAGVAARRPWQLLWPP